MAAKSAMMPLPDLKKQDGGIKQLTALMVKLRSKTSQLKSWTETAKAVRLSLGEKRHSLDSFDRPQLQKSVDTLQKAIKVTSLQSIVERLDSITRQLGLKFTAGPNGTDCFISSDMFYVEVLLETSGEVNDVKIAHQGDPVSCPELTKVLSSGDFTEFTNHLEGLAAIYQLNADKKQKTKAYLALQALETDLLMLAQLQSSINEAVNLVHKSPVGILLDRKGGYPLTLIYFVSPYDLLDEKSKSAITLSVDTVIEKQLGHSVKVCIEGSSTHKLQTMSLISVSKTSDGKSLPSFAALSNLNSTTLSASFVLKLHSPIPMTTSLVKKIQQVTNVDIPGLSPPQPLMSLIIQHYRNKPDKARHKGLFVTLPDQHHCYFLNENPNLDGVMVSRIPFIHPTHVPQILVFLRQQELFNFFIGSCVRSSSKEDPASALIFEVTVLSWQHISVAFEHPLQESMATAEFDLIDITNIKCKVHTLSTDEPICTDEYASKVAQRCWSIPVTMRAVIKKPQRNCSINNGSVCMVSAQDGTSTRFSQSFNDSLNSSKSLDLDVRLKSGGINANMIVQGNGKFEVNGQNTMSSSYSVSTHDLSATDTLENLDTPQNYIDSSLVQTDIIPSPHADNRGNSGGGLQRRSQTAKLNLSSEQSHQLPSGPGKRKRKRKVTSENRSPGSTSNKSPKRRIGEDELSRDMTTPEVEPTGSPGNPLLDVAFQSNLNSLISPISESHVSKLASTLDQIIKTETEAMQCKDEISISSVESNKPQESATTDDNLSLVEIIDSAAENEPSIDPDNFSNPASTNAEGEYNFSEPLDFNTEVLSNPDPSFADSLIENSEELDLENCDAANFGPSLNPTVVATKLSNEKIKEESSGKSKNEDKIKSEKGSEIKTTKQLESPAIDSSVVSKNSTSTISKISLKELPQSTDLTEKTADMEVEDITLTKSQTLRSATAKAKEQQQQAEAAKDDKKLKKRESRRSSGASDTSTSSDSGKRKLVKSQDKPGKRRRSEIVTNSGNKSAGRSTPTSRSTTPPANFRQPSPVTPPISKTPPYSKSSTPTTTNAKPSANKATESSASSSFKSVPLSKKNNSSSASPSSNAKIVPILKPQSSVKLSSSSSSSKSSSVSLKNSGSSSNHKSLIKSASSGNIHSKSPSQVNQSPNSKNSSQSSSTLNKTAANLKSVSGSSSSSLKVTTKSATVKLKPLSIPANSTVNTSNMKVSTTNSTSTANTTNSSSSATSTPTTPQSAQPTFPVPAQPTSQHGKSKSPIRSRKGSLSAVIDKLKVQAGGVQINSTEETENSKDKKETSSEGNTKQAKYSNPSEKKDNKADSKSNSSKPVQKDVALLSKSSDKRDTSKSNNKSESSKNSSDKPQDIKKSDSGSKASSQPPIKLNFTKTASSDGSYKLTSSVTSSKHASSKSISSKKSLSSSNQKSPSLSSTRKPNNPTSSPVKSSNMSNSIESIPKSNSGSSSSSSKMSALSSKKSGQKLNSSSSSSKTTPSTKTSSINFGQNKSSTKTNETESKKSEKEKNDSNKVKSETKSRIESSSERKTSTHSIDIRSSNKEDDFIIILEEKISKSQKENRPNPVETDDKSRKKLSKDKSLFGSSNGSKMSETGLEDSSKKSVDDSSSTNMNKMETSVESKAYTADNAENICPEKTISPLKKEKSIDFNKPNKINSPKVSKVDNGQTYVCDPFNKKMLEEKSDSKSEGSIANIEDKSKSKKYEDKKVVEEQLKNHESENKNEKFTKHRKQITPAQSEASSPEDSLVIDCPGTPGKSPANTYSPFTSQNSSLGSPLNQTKSPAARTPISPAAPSSGLKSQDSPHISLITGKSSTPGTPHTTSDHSNPPSTVSHTSPCVIDDDLMEEALMGLGK